MKPSLAAWRRRLGVWLERWPRLHVRLLRLRHRNRPFLARIVGPDTQIVIEGYPRSGNSFANRAFAYAQPTEVRIATHTHAAAQVEVAARRGLPTLVVVRDPAEAIPSLHALREQVRRTDPGRPPVDVIDELRRYVRFHRRVLTVADRVVVAPFAEIVTDYGEVIRRVNARFEVDFEPFDHTAEHVDAVFTSSGDHLSPSAARDGDKEIGHQRYAAAPAALRAEADEVYRRVLAVAEQQRLVG